MRRLCRATWEKVRSSRCLPWFRVDFVARVVEVRGKQSGLHHKGHSSVVWFVVAMCQMVCDTRYSQIEMIGLICVSDGTRTDVLDVVVEFENAQY